MALSIDAQRILAFMTARAEDGATVEEMASFSGIQERSLRRTILIELRGFVAQSQEYRKTRRGHGASVWLRTVKEA